MRVVARCLACLAVPLLLFAPTKSLATDVDGPNDCTRNWRDFGDAPEGIPAYPAVPGCFPTCMVVGPPGTQTIAAGCLPVSGPPGPTGFVQINGNPGGYWLGCTPGIPQGVDGELDGKVSLGGGPSACANIPVDCVEPVWAAYGQDECYGTNDACLGAAPLLMTCMTTSFTFTTFNCGPQRQAYLNVLVDWNQDGDWNDVLACGNVCAPEWAVINVPIAVPAGCATLTTPLFQVGPNAGYGWLRISITDVPVANNYPWNGGIYPGGEVEDYPVTIQQWQGSCPNYQDFGDAPEALAAYPSGVIGAFPTCTTPFGGGSATGPCPTVPFGPIGYVQHTSTPASPHFWLGCTGPIPPVFVDSETDGKVNLGGGPSACNPAVPTDCLEAAFGGLMTFGQDECTADGVDAGVLGPFTFTACATSAVTYNVYNCDPQDVQGFLNILIDWNEDGDWLDNFACPNAGCVDEWVVRNFPVAFTPGCVTYTSPVFTAGPNGGRGWMRVSISREPAPGDFAWNGTVSLPGSTFTGGETEDYPVQIQGPQSGCNIQYRDYGDAPEGFQAYPSGIRGLFPSCNAAFPPGDQDILACPPISTPPGLTGRVLHLAAAADPFHFWFGCTAVPPGSIDSEPDAKTSLAAGVSFCDNTTAVDCGEVMGPLTFGQDECYADVDAGIAGAPLVFSACASSSFPYQLYNCSQQTVTVFLNLMVDWNQDGDWNDVLQCPGPVCVPEWAVKNVPVTLAPGCNALVTPAIAAGPFPGPAWMRITATADPVPDDYPWNGSDGTALGYFRGGETEDYPVTIQAGPTGIVEPDARQGLWLEAPEPNPSSDGLTLRFGLSRPGPASVGVFDLAGRRVATLASGMMAEGPHVVRWDHRDLSGRMAPVGMYLIRLEAEGRVLTQRAIRVE